jgi:hypothetical protein
MVHVHTYNIYAAKCFGISSFCLHPLSLHILTDISNYEHLAKYVITRWTNPKEGLAGSRLRHGFSDDTQDSKAKYSKRSIIGYGCSR